MAKILLKGSERSAVQGARVVAPANPAERLEVSVLVRRRDDPGYLPDLTAEQQQHSADPVDWTTPKL